MLTLLNRFSKYSVVILGFLAITLSHAQDERDENISILDVDANGEVDALTDGLLLLRSMFGLTDDILTTGVVSANATVSDSVAIDSYITSMKNTTYGKLNSSGEAGPAGPQGEKGDKGDTGAAGATGPSGAAGADSTVAGPIGPAGAKGDTGSEGAQGESGVAGSINDLTDALIEDSSIYIGNNPSSTNGASQNVAIGTIALDSITTGDANVAVGYNALTTNTEGNNNTATGNGALYQNTTGSYNTASGNTALYSNIGGNYNTATGNRALNKNTTGDSNTATGKGALYENITGSYNIAAGESGSRVVGVPRVVPACEPPLPCRIYITAIDATQQCRRLLGKIGVGLVREDDREVKVEDVPAPAVVHRQLHGPRPEFVTLHSFPRLSFEVAPHVARPFPARPKLRQELHGSSTARRVILDRCHSGLLHSLHAPTVGDYLADC